MKIFLKLYQELDESILNYPSAKEVIQWVFRDSPRIKAKKFKIVVHHIWIL